MKACIPDTLTADDRDIAYDVFTLGLLADLIIPFQAYKDQEYDSHWAKRGLMGYKDGCIFRQTDRIEPGFKNLIAACEFDDATLELLQNAEVTLAAASLLDTLLDSVVYSLLGICLISAKFPLAGEAFKKKMFHRVLNGVDMAETDLDLDGKALDSELASKLAAYYRAKLEARNDNQ